MSVVHHKFYSLIQHVMESFINYVSGNSINLEQLYSLRIVFIIVKLCGANTAMVVWFDLLF
ncbi:MAG: hypothetical protein ACJAWQ_001601 [Paraglaciecola sp.]|jgi:hypothetical protein